MTIFEMLSFNKELLHKFSDAGIASTKSYQYVDLYSDYIGMKRDGIKITYIVSVLSERYNVCERKVYNVVQLLSKDCNCDAV